VHRSLPCRERNAERNAESAVRIAERSAAELSLDEEKKRKANNLRQHLRGTVRDYYEHRY